MDSLGALALASEPSYDTRVSKIIIIRLCEGGIIIKLFPIRFLRLSLSRARTSRARAVGARPLWAESQSHLLPDEVQPLRAVVLSAHRAHRHMKPDPGQKKSIK